jgi:hypothetical protein
LNIKRPRDKNRTFYELYLVMKLGKIPKPNIPEHPGSLLDNYFRTAKALPLG